MLLDPTSFGRAGDRPLPADAEWHRRRCAWSGSSPTSIASSSRAAARRTGSSGAPRRRRRSRSGSTTLGLSAQPRCCVQCGLRSDDWAASGPAHSINGRLAIDRTGPKHD